MGMTSKNVNTNLYYDYLSSRLCANIKYETQKIGGTKFKTIFFCYVFYV